MTRLLCPKCGCTKEEDIKIVKLSNTDTEILCVQCDTIFYFNRPCIDCDSQVEYERWRDAFK